MRPDPVQDPMLVLCPIGQEGHVNGELLRDRGLPVRVIDGFAIPGGYAETGGLLVAEEAFDRFDPQPLFSWLETQPPWSDYPIILLRNRESSVTGQIEARFERLGNLTILERPLHPTTLVSAANTALRARFRRREAEAYMLERLRDAEALREFEGRFRSLADNAPSLIWMTDRDGQVIYAKRRHSDLFGEPPEGFAGSGWQIPILDEDRSAVEAAWRQARLARATLNLEYRVWGKDGALHWLHCEAAPRECDGAYLGHVASANNITALKTSAELLERRVEERTAELAAANRQLLSEIAEREKMAATLLKVLGFAQQSGGGVAIETELGRGTTVKVYLPRATAARADPHTSLLADGLKVAEKGGTVLVVDDDEFVREITCQMLQQLGYRVLQAGSGGAALELLAGRHKIDLLIVDFAMPGMNGIELAKLAAGKWPQLPILMATGFADHSAIQHLAAEQVLTKPFSQAELAQRVRRALEDGVGATA